MTANGAGPEAFWMVKSACGASDVGGTVVNDQVVAAILAVEEAPNPTPVRLTIYVSPAESGCEGVSVVVRLAGS
jgi:hypothetical protein